MYFGIFGARAATFIVSNVNNSGAGSLRQAILDANANAGTDSIIFQIPGAGVHTISPLSALPSISDPVIIDGTTQPGYTVQPLVELNGAAAGGNAGLRLVVGNNTVRGLAINRFLLDGINITGLGTNLIAGNYIGTDPGGLLSHGNIQEGILINGSGGNVIGGTNSSDRNLISGNGDAGVYILNSVGNIVLGNYIGTTVTGASRLGNTNNGIAIYNSAFNQVGDASSAGRNVISGNVGSGIYLYTSGSTGNAIRGNYIGTDASGLLALGNSADGVSFFGAASNTIGGTNSGSGNLISGNGLAGLSLSGGATGNVLQGNLIGTDATGNLSLGNMLAGVTVSGSSGNMIGGNSAGARNLISGNKQDGVFVTTGSSANTVAGNFLGVKMSGASVLSNAFNGITISDASSNSCIGNVISGNAAYGVQLLGSSRVNSLQGNFIGTDPAGANALPNLLSGVRIESPANIVGTSGAGNVISGNGLDGIFIVGTAAASNIVQANFIGTVSGGSAGLGNGRAGVGISGATASIIGAAGAGNIISANKTDAGIYLIGSSATRNQIQGNVIGADATGNFALANGYEGIYLERAATNFIGGPLAGAGNLISGNSTRGIWLTNASWNVIQGNLIGTKSDGVSALGNPFHNVECEAGANNNTIGGSAPGAGNRIAFAQSIYAGVRIRNGATNNAILGNSIFSNGALGIDLGTFGVTANDACDSDTGANMLQNFPVLTQAVSGAGVGVRGTLNSSSGQTFLLQFFASPTCDSSGNGEGQIYLGDKSVFIPNAGCSTNFVATFAPSVPVGYAITATATDAANNTSEFSQCISADPVPKLSLSRAGGQQITLAWPNTSPGFVLKQTGSLSPPISWITVTNVLVNSNGQFVVTISNIASNRFFVLSFE